MYYNISFAHSEENYMEERNCCDEEDIIEEKGSSR
jgi:hypothetical protein